MRGNLIFSSSPEVRKARKYWNLDLNPDILTPEHVPFWGADIWARTLKMRSRQEYISAGTSLVV